MRNYLCNCRMSMLEFKKTRSIVLMALLAAMSIVVSAFKIKLFPYLHIGFSTLVNQYAYLLIGPVAGSIFGAILDIIKAILMPSGAFDIIYTIPPILAGFIYGSFYYKNKLTIVNCLVANFIVKLICNIIITTAIMTFTQGKALMAILPIRALKNLIQWPVDSLIFFAFAKLLNDILRKGKRNSEDFS